jgi:predicted TPR repeat methyltransferase
VLSADTLNYFGNLTGVFHDTRYALRDGGWFLFTLEVAENEDSSSRYALNSHGRYSHPESYIRNELEHAGFRIHSMEISTLRKEAKKEVAGWIIAAQQHKYLYQE